MAKGRIDLYKYRLYTETKPGLSKLVMRHLESATLIQAFGIWKGKEELITIIEYGSAKDNLDDMHKIEALAKDILKTNSQSTICLSVNPTYWEELALVKGDLSIHAIANPEEV